VIRMFIPITNDNIRKVDPKKLGLIKKSNILIKINYSKVNRKVNGRIITCYKVTDWISNINCVKRLHMDYELYPNFISLYCKGKELLVRRRDGVYILFYDENYVIPFQIHAIFAYSIASKPLTIERFFKLLINEDSKKYEKIIYRLMADILAMCIALDLAIVYDKDSQTCIKI